MQPWETERLILEQIRRHKISIERLLPMEVPDRALSTIEKLVQTRRISQWDHECGMRYWTQFAKRPLSNQSLIGALGMLLFLDQSSGRTAITPEDISTYFPHLFRKGLPRGYFVEHHQRHTRLGLAKVDSCSRVSRIVSRTLRCIDKHRSDAGFRTLIDEDLFEIVWIMPTREKCRRTAAALALCQASQVSVRTIEIPELLEVSAAIPSS